MGRWLATGFEFGKSNSGSDEEQSVDLTTEHGFLTGYLPQFSNWPIARALNIAGTNVSSTDAGSRRWKFNSDGRTKADGVRGGHITSDPNTNECALLLFNGNAINPQGSEEGNSVKTDLVNGFGATWFARADSPDATSDSQLCGFAHDGKWYRLEHKGSTGDMRIIETVSVNMATGASPVATGVSTGVLTGGTWYKIEASLSSAGVINFTVNGVNLSYDTTVAANMAGSEAQCSSSLGTDNINLIIQVGFPDRLGNSSYIDDLIIYSNDPAFTGDTAVGQPPAIKGAGSLASATNGAATTMSATGGAANAFVGVTDGNDATGASAPNNGDVLEADYAAFSTIFNSGTLPEASVQDKLLGINIFARQLESNGSLSMDGKISDGVDTRNEEFELPGTPGYKSVQLRELKQVGDTRTDFDKSDIASMTMELERTL